MVSRRRSLWARSLFFRLACYSALNSLALCGLFAAAMRARPGILIHSWPDILLGLPQLACHFFWVTFLLLGFAFLVYRAIAGDDSPDPPESSDHTG